MESDQWVTSTADGDPPHASPALDPREPPGGSVATDDTTSLAYWQRAAELSPTNFAAYTQIGHIHLKAGDLESARDAYQEAQRIKPGHVPSLFGMARTAERLGEFEEALQLLLPLLERQPDNAEAALLASRLLADYERHEEAEAVLARAVAKRGTHVGLLAALARQATAADPRERALRCWMAVREVEPRHPQAAVQAGRLLFELRRLPEAERLLREAIDIKPDHQNANATLAQVLHALGRDDEALAAWDAVMAIAEDKMPARVQRSAVLIDLDRPEDALEELKALRELAPENRNVLRLMARAEERAERWEVALGHWQAVLANQPGNREAADHIRLCRTLIDRESGRREPQREAAGTAPKKRRGLFGRS